MPRLMIIAVGDELLEGRTVDSNSRVIERALGAFGVRVALGQVVPDEMAAIAAALERTEPGDLVFLTGGLGSTPDDLTRDAVASWAGVTLEEDPSIRAMLTERWRRRGFKSTRGIDAQCRRPEGLEPLVNPVGSAPGLVGVLGGRTLALLPGVPAEMTGLLPLVMEWLDARNILPAPGRTRLWRTAQIAELTLVGLLKDVRARYGNLRWSYWLDDWGVDLRLAEDEDGDHAAGDLDRAAAEIERIVGYRIYSRDNVPLPAAVQRLAIDQGATVAVAESCTAGLIGGSLTAASGSSGFFRGGILAYADDVKRDLLDVPASILAGKGAVSQETVLAMAAGCRERLATDYAVAVSGISGPGGQSAGKPVGTTWIAVASARAAHAHCYRFPGDRKRNRWLTVAAAVDSLRRVLEFGDADTPWRAEDDWCRAR